MKAKEKDSINELVNVAKGLSKASQDALLRFGNDLQIIDRVKKNAKHR